MSVHRYLVTSTPDTKMRAWLPTASYANWIEGRSLTDGRETWLVTVYDEHSTPFLTAARAAGDTVERVQGGGDTESYELLAGEPGSGWNPDLWDRADDDDPHTGVQAVERLAVELSSHGPLDQDSDTCICGEQVGIYWQTHLSRRALALLREQP